jgi:hypothetical protein
MNLNHSNKHIFRFEGGQKEVTVKYYFRIQKGLLV